MESIIPLRDAPGESNQIKNFKRTENCKARVLMEEEVSQLTKWCVHGGNLEQAFYCLFGYVINLQPHGHGSVMNE